MARTTLLTTDRAKRIAAAIAAGNDQETAARANGISKSTHYSWVQRGSKERDKRQAWEQMTQADRKNAIQAFKSDQALEEHERTGIEDPRPKAAEEPFLEYLDTIEQALAEAEVTLVLQIRKAAAEPRHYQAAAWLLTHGPSKHKWKAITATEVSGPDGSPIQTENVYTEADLQALADKIMGLGPIIPQLEKNEESE